MAPKKLFQSNWKATKEALLNRTQPLKWTKKVCSRWREVEPGREHENFEVIVLSANRETTLEERNIIKLWCWQNLGEQDEPWGVYRYSAFWFRDEATVTLFLLQWQSKLPEDSDVDWSE